MKKRSKKPTNEYVRCLYCNHACSPDEEQETAALLHASEKEARLICFGCASLWCGHLSPDEALSQLRRREKWLTSESDVPLPIYVPKKHSAPLLAGRV